MSESGLRLSLERLYKDNLGRPIPAVFDITQDGHYILEPCVSSIFGVAIFWKLTTCYGQRRATWLTAWGEFEANVLGTRLRLL
jgi:hypothetical protein